MSGRKHSKFLHVSAILFLSLLLVGLGLLVLLWDFLAEYEQSTPRAAGEQVLALYRAGDFDAAMELAGVDPALFFDGGQYAAYVGETLGDLKAVRVQEGGSREGRRTVQLIGGEGNSLRFFLTELPGTLRYGLSRLRPEQEAVPVKSYVIRAPGHAVVTANGEALPAACRTGTEAVEGFPSLPEGLLSPAETVYRAEGFTVEPDWALEGYGADSYRLERTEDGVVFTLLSAEEDCARLALEASQTYAKFISRDAALESLTRYLYPGTDFAAAVNNFSNIWYNSHNGVEFDGLRTENAVEYSADYVSVEVAFDYVVYRGSAANRWGEWRYPTRYRVYLVRTDGGWKVLEIRGV